MHIPTQPIVGGVIEVSMLYGFIGRMSKSNAYEQKATCDEGVVDVRTLSLG
jgi:hypothetical protein